MIKKYIFIILSFLITSNLANAQCRGLINHLKDQLTDAISHSNTQQKAPVSQQADALNPTQVSNSTLPVVNELSSNKANNKNITLVKNQYPEDIQGIFSVLDGDLKKLRIKHRV